ncbi:MAG: hypothetical protein KBE65_15360 [Phycisphaerae bacterium]|nr:hypothetical protein [Phycisphaerae bacterium]
MLDLIQQNIDQYKEDVESSFPVTLMVIPGTWSSAETIRQELIALYESEGISGAILVGSLPYARWTFPWGERCVAPFFYEDLDGDWLDTNNDGYYDYHTWGIRDGAEIWVSFIRPTRPTGREAASLRSFFEKTHAYYQKEFMLDDRALVYVSHDWRSFTEDLEEVLSPVFGSSIDALGGEPYYSNGSSYLTMLQGYAYTLVTVWSHAGPDAHTFDASPQRVTSQNILAQPSVGLLTHIWGCSVGNFMESDAGQFDNLALSYLFGDNYGLAVCAATRSIGTEKHEAVFRTMGLGLDLGIGYAEVLRAAYNSSFIKQRFSSDDVNRFIWGWALMGNPFITITDTTPTYRAPNHVLNATAGLIYEYYEGSWSALPPFNSLTPIATGWADSFTVAPKRRQNRYALRFKGFINVERSGVYTFATKSNDGSQLYIGNALVVDNDGLHAKQKRAGCLLLTQGMHPITVTFFDDTGVDILEVEYGGPGIPDQIIPSDVLFTGSDGGQSGPPVAQDMAVSASISTPVIVTLEAVDDGRPNPPGSLSYTIVSLPKHGRLESVGGAAITTVPAALANPADKVVYRPNQDWIGDDSFTFYAHDGGTAPLGGKSNTATVNITIVREITVEYRIADGKDDAHGMKFAISQWVDTPALAIGGYAGGVRFRNVEIPQGALIRSASLKICSYSVGLTGQFDGILYAEDIDNSTDFNTTRLSKQTKTQASQAWAWDAASPWTADTWYESPDITDLVQEVVDRAGWSSGNAMTLIYWANSNSGSDRKIWAYEGNPDRAARLVITYQPR